MSCLNLRLADAETVTQYPLPISESIRWTSEAAPSPTGQPCWACQISLPALPAGTIVIPSLSVLDRPGYRFQFELETGEEAYPLPVVPAEATAAGQRNGERPAGKRVRTAIDCFQLLEDAEDATLNVRCWSGSAPERYLLTVTARPLELDGPCPPPARNAVARTPPRYSQLLENPRHARRICSPVSAAMVLAGFRPEFSRAHLIADCHDPVTGMYGIWPLAIRAASLRGSIGAVEAVADWEPVLTVLEAGLPLVASIRYPGGALPGSPMQATAGHLVVVHGVDGSEVLVNDPAAPDHGTVSRRYPVDAFAAAWFLHRGAAYILLP